jgi:hypothetical protein
LGTSAARLSRMTQPSKLLRQILSRIRDLKAQNQAPLVVFDLDSTLFDVSPRMQKILHDFAEKEENQRNFPESCEIMKKIETVRSDWGIKKALIRAGLDGHHPDFHHAVREFWHKNFFGNYYVDFDVPYEGAQEYVQAVAEAGAEIVYLTGRDVERMQEGTIRVLKKWNFPLDEERARLILKPHRNMDDAKFKSDFFAALPARRYQTVWFFENEPVNTNLVKGAHAHVEIVFFESTHSGRENPHPELPKIMHYLLDEEG